MKISLKEKPITFCLTAGILSSLMVCILILLLVILGVDFSSFTNTATKQLSKQDNGLYLVVIVAYIAAPIIETLLMQYGIMKIISWVLTKITKNNSNKYKYIIPGIIATTLFALDHRYSIWYIFIIIIPAITFQYIMIKSKIEGFKDIKAIGLTAFTHFIYNLFVGIFNIGVMYILYKINKIPNPFV